MHRILEDLLKNCKRHPVVKIHQRSFEREQLFQQEELDPRNAILSSMQQFEGNGPCTVLRLSENKLSAFCEENGLDYKLEDLSNAFLFWQKEESAKNELQHSGLQGLYLQPLSNEIQGKFEQRFKEACKIWGVDVNDLEEIEDRCQIIKYEGDGLNEFYIDGLLVMKYTDWRMDPFVPGDTLKVSASFRCSEISLPPPNHRK